MTIMHQYKSLNFKGETYYDDILTSNNTYFMLTNYLFPNLFPKIGKYLLKYNSY